MAFLNIPWRSDGLALGYVKFFLFRAVWEILLPVKVNRVELRWSPHFQHCFWLVLCDRELCGWITPAVVPILFLGALPFPWIASRKDSPVNIAPSVSAHYVTDQCSCQGQEPSWCCACLVLVTLSSAPGYLQSLVYLPLTAMPSEPWKQSVVVKIQREWDIGDSTVIFSLVI